MIAAVGTFAVMDALMKILASDYPPLQIACLRGASSLPFVIAASVATRRLGQLRPRRFGLHLLRAAIAIAMLGCYIWALARMSMANTYAICLCAPLLVVPCAWLVLGEKAGRHVWVALLAGLAGVFVILKPTAIGFASLAGLAALGAAVAWALVVVTLRLMAATETTASMVFWFLLLLAIGAGVLAAPGWVAIASGDWPWIALMGLAGWAAQHLVTDAFRLAPAATIAPFEYMSVVWGAAIDWVVWHTLPGARVLAGAAIVVAAGLYLIHRQSL